MLFLTTSLICFLTICLCQFHFCVSMPILVQQDKDNSGINGTLKDDYDYPAAVLFFDRWMAHIFAAAGIILLLCLPPEAPIIGVLARATYSSLAKRHTSLFSTAKGPKLPTHDGSSNCQICRQPMQSDKGFRDIHRPVYLMNCDHRFGFSCIQSHLQSGNQQSCPTCGKYADFLHVFNVT